MGHTSPLASQAAHLLPIAANSIYAAYLLEITNNFIDTFSVRVGKLRLVKKKIKANIQFYGIIILFIFVVTLVEIVKTAEAKTYAGVFENQDDSQALIALPIFSIAIVLLLAIPRKNF